MNVNMTLGGWCRVVAALKYAASQSNMPEFKAGALHAAESIKTQVKEQS